MIDEMPSEHTVEDFADVVNGLEDGFCRAMGVRFLRAGLDEVVAELAIGPQHRQPYGIVHGGVYAGMVESVASVGAGVWAMMNGLSVVGLDNHTSFVHAVREGTLRATGRPVHRGKRSQLWDAVVCDGGGRVVATGRVRLMVLEGGASIAGEVVNLKIPGA
jgi:1,4-dihydroxy-2-naphthoyl-CoA hydrolase